MPCALTKGFTLDCKDGVGGVKEVKIKARPDDLSAITVNTDGSATIGVGLRTGWYTYELNKEDGTLEEKQSLNPANRTIAYDVTLKFSMFNLTKDKQTELQLVAKNELLVAVKLNDGSAWLLGYDLGGDLTERNYISGKAIVDKNGYDVTILFKGLRPILDITTDYSTLTAT